MDWRLPQPGRPRPDPVPATSAAEVRRGPPIELVDQAAIPGGGTLRLLKCGTEFSIQFGDEELMGSRDHRSEQALASLTHQRLGGADGDILIGGLGMGFTLGAALAAWTQESSFVVAELVPSVVTWARGPLAHLSGVHLADPRVSLKLIDVHDEISAARNRYDAILLDVDNGPEGFIKLENDRLYCNWGLREAHAALRPGGVLAIWSAFPDPDFVERLEAAGFEVDETLVPAFADAVDDWHRLLFAAKPN